VLIIGHNLTDRIETSLMNMRRGCQVRGFVNMKVQEGKKWSKSGQKVVKDQILHTHYPSLVTRYHFLRPLLQYSKKQVQEYCDEHKIPYMIDASNADITVSQRNRIRHEIVMKLSDQELVNRQ
jgi:tRNA(Ile)-lysidine synthase TilS/MesJ